MTRYKENNIDIIISGYVRKINFGKYVLNDIMSVIMEFHGIFCCFNVFNSDGKKCLKDTSYIAVNNERLLGLTRDNQFVCYKDGGSGSRIFVYTQALNKINDPIVLTSTGIWSFYAFVYTNNSKLYGFSSEDECDGKSLEKRLIQYNFDSVITDIKCAVGFGLLLTSNKNVYGCGRNDYGQLTKSYSKHGKLENRLMVNMTDIRMIINSGDIISINCFGSSSMILNDKNILKIFGHKVDTVSQEYNDITNVTKSKVIMFNCGYLHAGYITENNELFMMGDNEFSQCGTIHGMPNYSQRTSKVRINVDAKIVDIKCGVYYSMINPSVKLILL